MLEKEYMVDQQRIAEYFALDSSVMGMFETLFGLLFTRITDAANGLIWHEDVHLFSVWNDEGQGGQFVGYLYLDLYSRSGKFGHVANFNLQPVGIPSVRVQFQLIINVSRDLWTPMAIEVTRPQHWCAIFRSQKGPSLAFCNTTNW